MTINPELVTATDLDELSDRLESRELVPRLVRRLLTRTDGVEGVTLRANEGIGVPGWDGEVAAATGSAYVPAGPSAWEIGTGGDPKTKAQRDYKKRSKKPLGVVPAQSAFVFVTSRRWSDKQDWVTEKKKDGAWRDVKVIDCDDLHGWLELKPGVHIWISEQLGRRPMGVETMERWAAQWSTRTDPALPLGLMLAGRTGEALTLGTFLAGDATAIGVKAGSRDEAMGFIAAALLTRPPSSPDTNEGEPDAPAKGPEMPIHGEEQVRSDSEQSDIPSGEHGPGPSEAAEPVDMLPGSRALVVQDSEVWRRLIDSPSPLVLIPITEEADIAAALAARHHVIRPLGPGDGVGRGSLIDLPRLDRTAAREALQPVFGSFEEADRRAAAARRSLVSLRRSLRRDPQRTRPPWAEPPDSEKLAPLLLGGSWRSSSADSEKIAALAREDYPDLERRLTRLAATDDPPLRLGDFEWHLSSPEDAWDLLSPQLTADDAERWREISLEVLGEIDPLLGLERDVRMLAAFRGEPRRKWSTSLRRGLAEGAALLGWAGEENQKISGRRTSDWADTVVAELLEHANWDASGTRWRSLADVLPLLAEAAPETFLTAVEQGVKGDEPVLRLMFEDGPGTSSLDTHSAHSWLLWAVEGLCWSEDYLVRCCAALAKLERIDPGGRLGNRPGRSLRTVLLPWIPRTRANVARRLQALDAVRYADPQIGFDLILAVWPRHHDTSDRAFMPRFRQWQRDPEGATYGEISAFVSGLVARALEDAQADSKRWVKLVERITTVSQSDQEQMLVALEALDPEQLGEDLRAELWGALVGLVERHRTFADADWAMPVTLRDRLEAQATRIEPVRTVERHARLFEHRPDIPGVNRRDFEAYTNALTEVRVAAVNDALAEEGLAGVLRLGAASRLPAAVGDALAVATEDEHAEEILPLLESNEADIALASGFIRRRNFEDGPEWAKHQAARIAEWPEERQVMFLRALPPGDATSVLAESASPPARQRYWAEVEPFTSAHEAEAFTKRLLEAHRAWAAIGLLELYAIKGDHETWHPNAELIIRVLDQALAEDPTAALQSGMTSYEIGRLLDRLEELGTERATLARLEWAFDPLLSNERTPRALHAELADSPELFVELVSRLYKPDPDESPRSDAKAGAAGMEQEAPVVHTGSATNDQTETIVGEASEDPNAGMANAPDSPAADREEGAGFLQSAWSVLHHWHRPPGTRGDGTVDREHLKQWVTEARALFAQHNRTRIGDSQLGQLLARSFPGEDGIWPAEAVRELIEELNSKPFDEGFRVGRMNSRGVTTRDVYSGGSLERQLATGYRDAAAKLEVRWPHTAQILRGLQRTYERIADREDDEAGRRADEP